MIEPTAAEDRAQLRYWLKDDEYAIRFCEQFFFLCHLWDDLIDKDVERNSQDIDSAFWMALIEIPSNPFYRKFFAALHPVIENVVLEWHNANTLEKANDLAASNDRQISYVLRCSILSVILQCAYLIGGYEWAREVGPSIRRYGQRESFDEYVEDLNNA